MQNCRCFLVRHFWLVKRWRRVSIKPLQYGFRPMGGCILRGCGNLLGKWSDLRNLACATICNQLLHTADRHALIIEQSLYAREQVNVSWSIIPSPACPFHGLDLRKLAFPKAQHMRRHLQCVRRLADCAKRVRCLVHEVPLLSVAFGHAVFHQMRWTKGQHAARRDRNFFASFWVPSNAGGFVSHRERSKGRYLYLFAAHQRVRDMLQNRIYQQ